MLDSRNLVKRDQHRYIIAVECSSPFTNEVCRPVYTKLVMSHAESVNRAPYHGSSKPAAAVKITSHCQIITV